MPRRIPTNTIEWRFPLSGLNRSSPYRNQQEGTSPDLANVRAFDIVEGEGEYRERRARGGQRGGYETVYEFELEEGGKVIDLVLVRSGNAKGGMFVGVATLNPHGLWVGEGNLGNIFNWTFYARPDMDEDTRLIAYQGHIYAVMDVEKEEEEDVPDLPEITDPPEGAVAITDWDDLTDIWDDLDGTYKLENDLGVTTDGYDDYHSSLQGAIPIGDDTTPFTGEFYGQGYKISGLEMDRDSSRVGLFGKCDGAELYDLFIDNASIKGPDEEENDMVGILAGHFKGYVKNCHSSGTIEGYDHQVGGLIGYLSGGDTEVNESEVIHCSSKATVKGMVMVGGLIGAAGIGWSTIEQSKADCTIRGDSASSGFIGTIYISDGKHIIIRDCHSAGSVNTLVGTSNGFVCPFSGDEADDTYVFDCYSLTSVIAEGQGIAYGFSPTELAEAENCFWEYESAGTTNDGSQAEMKTEAEMLSIDTFSAWDIVAKGDYDPEDPPSHVWFMQDGSDYPNLWWEPYSIAIEARITMGRFWSSSTRAWRLWTVVRSHGFGVPTSVAVFRQRMVFGGTDLNPSEWFMSRSDNANDWDFGQTDSSAAVSGKQVGETITAVAPIRDDYMAIGSKKSLRMMVGDPMAGGSIQLISDSVGIYSHDSWCLDSAGNLYFSDGYDLFTFNPNEGLRNLTASVVQRMFEELSENDADGDRVDVISMTFDPKNEGIYVVQKNDETSKGWMIDMRTQGLFPDTYHQSIKPELTFFYDTESKVV